MRETENNAVRPIIKFYHNPTSDSLPGVLLTENSNPRIYFVDSAVKNGHGGEFAHLNAYFYEMVIVNTQSSDFGYYWCTLEFQGDHPDTGNINFQRQVINLQSMYPVYILCTDWNFQYSLDTPEKCCQGNRTTVTSGPPELPCCNTDQALGLSLGLIIGAILCVTILVVIAVINFTMIRMEKTSRIRTQQSKLLYYSTCY